MGVETHSGEAIGKDEFRLSLAGHGPPAEYPQPSEPEKLVLSFQLPQDLDFTVHIRAMDQRMTDVPSSRFLFDGKRWIATITLPLDSATKPTSLLATFPA